VLGQNTFVTINMVDVAGSSVITGITNNGADMTPADDGKTIAINQIPGSLATRFGNDELSNAANRILTDSIVDYTLPPQTTLWLRYNGDPAVGLNRWQFLSGR
jgi:hypothetical protein